MDQHLDWHFKYKKRMREAAGRASGRNWFTKEEVRRGRFAGLVPFPAASVD